MMIKILHIIKEKIMQQIFFAFTFALCLLPKLSFAVEPKTCDGLCEATGSRLWFTNECPLWSNYEKCYYCPLFKALYNAASIVARDAYNSLRGPLIAVIAVAAAIWLAQKIIKDLASFETVEPAKMVQEIAYQLFRCMVVVLILNANFTSVRSLTLDPVMETGMKIAQYFSGVKNCNEKVTGSVIGNGGLSTNVGNSMLCSVQGVEKQARDVIKLGLNGRCLAYDRDIGYLIDLKIIDFVIPNINYLITGWGLVLIGLVYLIGCPFLLVDSVINMCFAAALLPVGVACCAFKITTGHMKKIWDTFMEGAFHFIFLTLILYVMTKGVENIIGGLEIEESYEKGIDTYGSIINGVSFAGLNFLKLGFIFFLGWSVLEQSGELAKKFAPGGMNPGGGMGADVGKQAAHAAARFAGGTLTATGVALKAGAKATGLDAKAKELRGKAANAIKALSPINIAKKAHNLESSKAFRKVAKDKAHEFGKKTKTAFAASPVGMAAYAAKQKLDVAAGRTKAVVNKSIKDVANFLNEAKRDAKALKLRLNRRHQERLNKIAAFGQKIDNKTGIMKKSRKVFAFTKNMSADKAAELLGEGLGYALGAASVAGAGMALSTPAGQGILGAYAAGKIAAPPARHTYVGLEFAKSAIRVGIRNLDERMATGIRNMGVQKEFKQHFNRGGKLLGEQIYADMMKHNSFDEKNQAIAEKYRDQQLARDARTASGQEILEQRRQAHWDNAQNLHSQFEQKKAAEQAAAEERLAEEWRNYEKVLKEWKKHYDERSFMEKLLGVELSEKEILERKREKELIAKWEAELDAREKAEEAERQQTERDLAAANSISNNDDNA